MITGLVSNIQRYSLQDGPGIRTTVFLKGCPLRCWWCHNPEGRAPQAEVVIVETRCSRCGTCVQVCPQGNPAKPEAEAGAASGGEMQPPMQAAAVNVAELTVPESCILCGACAEACPTGARQVIGKQMTVEEVVAEVVSDRVFYEESRGGATFSGGEPLMQPEFLEALLAACRQHHIHTALDTCGYAPAEIFLKLAMMADLVLYDIKLLDDAKHCQFTGVSNGLILQNLKALGQHHRNIWIRIPLLPGINDQPAELDDLAWFLSAIPGIQQVNLLPYHRSAMLKFRRLGQEYRLAELVPPSPSQMQAAVAHFTALGLKARAGG